MQPLDPHRRPPDGIRYIYKRYQKMKLQHLDHDPEIIDLSRDLSADPKTKVRIVKELDADGLTATFRSFAGSDVALNGLESMATSSIPVYEHDDMPGRHR